MFNITNFSKDVVAYQIVPRLDAESTCSFASASKTAYALIKSIATQPHQDFDLDGKTITIHFDEKDDPIKSLCLLKIKTDKFTSGPEFFRWIKRANEFKNGLHELFEYSVRGVPSPCIVIFDFTTKQLTDFELNYAVNYTVDRRREFLEQKDDFGEDNRDTNFHSWRVYRQDDNRAETLLAIFLHPNANHLTSDSLSKCLTFAFETKNHNLIKKILAHPKAQEFEPGQLSDTLTAAIYADNQEAIQTLLTFPEANNLGVFCISPLRAAIDKKNQDLITLLLHHAEHLDANQLSRQLSVTIYETDLVTLLLDLPMAEQLKGYALLKILTVAVMADKQGLIQTILAHPNIHTISEDDFDLLLEENHFAGEVTQTIRDYLEAVPRKLDVPQDLKDFIAIKLKEINKG